MRKTAASYLISCTFQMIMAKRRFCLLKKGVSAMQKLYRRHVKRREMAVINIQATIRMKIDSKYYLKVKSAVVLLQCWQRCCAARENLIASKETKKTKKTKLICYKDAPFGGKDQAKKITDNPHCSNAYYNTFCKTGKGDVTACSNIKIALNLPDEAKAG